LSRDGKRTAHSQPVFTGAQPTSAARQHAHAPRRVLPGSGGTPYVPCGMREQKGRAAVMAATYARSAGATPSVVPEHRMGSCSSAAAASARKHACSQYRLWCSLPSVHPSGSSTASSGGRPQSAASAAAEPFAAGCGSTLRAAKRARASANTSVWKTTSRVSVSMTMGDAAQQLGRATAGRPRRGGPPETPAAAGANSLSTSSSWAACCSCAARSMARA
jgi:hypothetical protein